VLTSPTAKNFESWENDREATVFMAAWVKKATCELALGSYSTTAHPDAYAITPPAVHDNWVLVVDVKPNTDFNWTCQNPKKQKMRNEQEKKEEKKKACLFFRGWREGSEGPPLTPCV